MKIEGFEGLPLKKTGRLDIKTVVLVILHGSLRRFHHQYPWVVKGIIDSTIVATKILMSMEKSSKKYPLVN